MNNSKRWIGTKQGTTAFGISVDEMLAHTHAVTTVRRTSTRVVLISVTNYEILKRYSLVRINQ